LMIPSTHRVKRFITGAVLAIAGTMIISTPVLAAGSRPTFTWAEPASYITFNSIVDNPAVGNEEHFLTVRHLGEEGYARSLKVSVGQELVFRIYYDNNAASNLNLVAKNTKVRLSLPTSESTAPPVSGYISADNATPKEVSDSITITSATPVSLLYEAGSAQIWNNSLRGQQLPDSIVTTGALIGFDKLDGQIGGGAKYSGYVTVKVKVSSTGVIAPGSVPNTGPGNIVGIFITVSLVATAGHILYSSRRVRG